MTLTRSEVVNVDHPLKLIRRQVLEPVGLRNSGIIDHDIQPPEGVNGRVNDGGSTVLARHRGAAGNSLPTLRFNLLHNVLGRLRRGSGSIQLTPEIDNDNLSPSCGKQSRVGAPNPAPGSGHNGRSPVEPHQVHLDSPLSCAGVEIGTCSPSRSPPTACALRCTDLGLTPTIPNICSGDLEPVSLVSFKKEAPMALSRPICGREGARSWIGRCSGQGRRRSTVASRRISPPIGSYRIHP